MSPYFYYLGRIIVEIVWDLNRWPVRNGERLELGGTKPWGTDVGMKKNGIQNRQAKIQITMCLKIYIEYVLI